MKLIDYIVLALIGAAIAAAVVFIVRRHRRGKCAGCGGDCESCGYNCKDRGNEGK